MFVRANSLKAWKEDQDRAKAEEEEKERAQSAKRARSAQKRVNFDILYCGFIMITRGSVLVDIVGNSDPQINVPNVLSPQSSFITNRKNLHSCVLINLTKNWNP